MREGNRRRRLSHPRLPFEQDGAADGEPEEEHGGQSVVAQVVACLGERQAEPISVGEGRHSVHSWFYLRKWTVALATEIKSQANITLFRGSAAERTGISGLEGIEEVTLLACPDAVAGYKAGVFSLDELKQIQTDMINHCQPTPVTVH